MTIIPQTTPHKSAQDRLLSQISLIVIHYTGSTNAISAVNWFKDPTAKVSAHFVIAQDGTIYAFENLNAKLWHAGHSSWQGRKWCNSYSIGYELAGTYDSGFTEEQYAAVEQLLAQHTEMCPVDSIVGHEHISPGRKIDPGPKFEWDRIRKQFQGNAQIKFIEGKPFVTEPEVIATLVEPKDVTIAEDSGLDIKEESVAMNAGIDPEEEKAEKRAKSKGMSSFFAMLAKLFDRLA